jgi:hypothetical protein
MGNAALAEELAREGLALARRSEAPWLQADALSELATVMALLGRTAEARQAIDEAIALYTSKGNEVSSARALAWAGRLQSA